MSVQLDFGTRSSWSGWKKCLENLHLLSLRGQLSLNRLSLLDEWLCEQFSVNRITIGQFADKTAERKSPSTTTTSTTSWRSTSRPLRTGTSTGGPTSRKGSYLISYFGRYSQRPRTSFRHHIIFFNEVIGCIKIFHFVNDNDQNEHLFLKKINQLGNCSHRLKVQAWKKDQQQQLRPRSNGLSLFACFFFPCWLCNRPQPCALLLNFFRLFGPEPLRTFRCSLTTQRKIISPVWLRAVTRLESANQNPYLGASGEITQLLFHLSQLYEPLGWINCWQL